MNNQNTDQKIQQNNPQADKKSNQFDEKKGNGTIKRDNEKVVKPDEFPEQSQERTSPTSGRRREELLQ